MAGKRGHYNVRLIRRDLSYTVEELTACLGVHENTVRKWIKSGLPVVDEKRPFLVHGAALIAFLNGRQASRKVRLKPDEFYCVKCRCPRTAFDGKVNILPRNRLMINLKSTCTVCRTALCKVGSMKNLSQYLVIFNSPAPGPPHISDTHSPSVNCALKGEHEDVQTDIHKTEPKK